MARKATRRRRYLRTAVSVDAQGWAQFGYLKMARLPWGIFLAEPEANRTIAFGITRASPRAECPASIAARCAG